MTDNDCPEPKRIKIPCNFDDKDLAIVAIALIAIAGSFLLTDSAEMILTNSISAIAGMATGASLDRIRSGYTDHSSRSS